MTAHTHTFPFGWQKMCAVRKFNHIRSLKFSHGSQANFGCWWLPSTLRVNLFLCYHCICNPGLLAHQPQGNVSAPYFVVGAVLTKTNMLTHLALHGVLIQLGLAVLQQVYLLSPFIRISYNNKILKCFY